MPLQFPSPANINQIYTNASGKRWTYNGTIWNAINEGLQGTQGIQGIQGTQGTQGTQGIQGLQGISGVLGSQGTQGTQGIQGVQGIQGAQGTQGTQGIQGITGSQGTQGIQGAQGLQGIQGVQGTQGIQGIQGITGLAFTIAKTYVSVAALTADTAPTGIVSGQFALINTSNVEDADNSKLYLWNGSIYIFQNDLSGTAGIQGITGSTGAQGTQGVQGIQGITGAQGTQGTQGIQGISGASILGLNNTFSGVNSININGTVGATTPSTVAATTISATGDITAASDIKSTGNPIIYSSNGGSAGTVQAGFQLIGPTEIRGYIGTSQKFSLTSTGLNSTAIGATTPSTGVFSTLSSRFATNPATDNGNGTNALQVFTTAAQGVGVGGAISLGGASKNDGTGLAAFAQIAGRKFNATVDNYLGYLEFSLNNAAGTMGNYMRLDTTGLAVTGNSTATGYLGAFSGGDAFCYLGTTSGGGDFGYLKWKDSNDTIILGTNTGGDTLTVNESGNVGIGTASPYLSRLHIFKSESGASPAAVLRVGNNGSGYTSRIIITDETTNDANISYIGGAGMLGFGIGSSLTQMVLTAAGNVGIGTTSPSATLHIKDPSYNQFTLRVQSAAANNANGYGGIGFSGEDANTKGAIFFQSLASNSYSRGNMIFALNNAEDQTSATPSNAVMTLTNDGKVFMCGSTASVSVERALMQFDGSGAYGFGIKCTSATGSHMRFYNSGGTDNGYIYSTNSTTMVYGSASDGRLKTNIRPLNDSGSIIDAIQPHIFDWKHGETLNCHGFIAQELNEVFPEAVVAGDDDEDVIKSTWGIDPAKLVPVLVAELQSLRKRLAALEATL